MRWRSPTALIVSKTAQPGTAAPKARALASARVIKAPERAMTTDVDALLAAVSPATRMVLIANPNNPTGSLLPQSEMERLAKGLPSDVLLRQLQFPAFHVLFQVMIFAALLESGTGMVHAVNARLAHSWRSWRGGEMPMAVRLGAALALLVGAIFVAGRFGLVTLIARGYTLLGWVFLAIYVLPLLTIGVLRLHRARPLRTAGPAALGPA